MASKFRQIALNANDLRTEIVTSSFWKDAEGTPFRAEVRSLPVAERNAAIRSAKNEDEEVDSALLAVAMVIAACFDPETGERMFEPADRETLLGKSGQAIDELRVAAFRLNGLGDESQAAAEKN